MVEDGSVHPDQYVWIEGDRIVAMGSGTPGAVPPGAEVVDLGDAWVVPGLIDMHVHMGLDDGPAFLDRGITTVRQMWGGPGALSLREKAAEGEALPSMIVASPGVDGPGGPIPGAEVVRNAADVRLLAERLDGGGWDAIKVYQFLGLEAYRELTRLARQHGWTLVGHVPTTVDLVDALRDLHTIEHLEGYDRALVGDRRPGFASWADADTIDMPELAALTAAAGAWNVPTLVVAERVASKNMDAAAATRVSLRRQSMVRALLAAGAGILVGSDAGVPVSPPGESFHDEIDALLASGLTSTEVLRAATSDAARALGLEGRIGSLRVGARADLVVLDANPLRVPATLRTPRAIVLRGEYRR